LVDGRVIAEYAAAKTRRTRERDMRVRGFLGKEKLQRRAAVVPSAGARSELVATCHDEEGCARGPATMPAERQRGSEDPAELVAHVSALKRDVLLRVHRHRLGFEDLEDCYSQATLELVSLARTRARAFQGEAHVANALEQRFLSRIADRRRALSGRSPIAAVTQAALRHADVQEGGPTVPFWPPSPTRRLMLPNALPGKTMCAACGSSPTN
jgi:hypothetical protein